MKILKGIGYFLLIILAAVLLAASFAPAQKSIERKTSINAPAEQVFDQIAEFRNWQNWDAWYKRDTLQERTFTGSYGDENQGYTWMSNNEDVGNGRMKMIAAENNERIDYRFFFASGDREDSASGYFQLEEKDGSTDVIWGMVSEMTYPWKFFNYFIEGMVGPDFEQGLSGLKDYIENVLSSKLAQNTKNVEIITEYGINYASVKATNMPMLEMEDFFKTSYESIFNYLKDNNLESKGPARGLFYEWDEENNKTTLAAAVPISDLLLEDLSMTPLSENDSAWLGTNQIQATSFGGYSDNYKVHTSLYEWVEGNNKELKSPIVEEYLVGPLESQDTSTYKTRIIYHF